MSDAARATAIEMGEQLWAWVSRYPDGSIGTVGARMPGMAGFVPLVMRSRETAEQLRAIARAHAEASGQRVWLREYTGFIDHGEA
jgi:hypothetical protein